MVTSNGNAESHFDNSRLEECIGRFQREGDAASLSEIVELSQRRAEVLIRFHGSARYCTEAELLSDIHYKLIKAVAKFDPARGSAFTFVSRVIFTSLHTSVALARRRDTRYVELDEIIANQLHTNGETKSRDALDDLEHRIRSGARTTLSDPAELQTMRWYVDSFLNGAFELRRHQCCDAAITVYGLRHDRSRELYDLCLLECRRVMYDSLPPQSPIAPGRLVVTRSSWALRYQPLLTAVEFSKFVTLTRGLNPFVVVLVNPKARSRRLDRNPTVGRQNLLWVLGGHPNAVKLFPF
jgi:hypothetical protein